MAYDGGVVAQPVRRLPRRGYATVVASAAAALACAATLACSAGTADQGSLPPDVQDPATIQTPSGALARYRGALAELPAAFARLMATSAVLTDELAALPTRFGYVGDFAPLDSRTGATDDLSYTRLHQVRAQAREARGFLASYAPDSSPALRGHLYAVEGYAELFLADLFCSGIPLSTVDFNGDYTLAAGSTTTEVYTHAVALFDSALALTSDSMRFQQFAALGRGRALLALGRYSDAAAAVASVPDDYRYQVPFYPSKFRLDRAASGEATLLWYFLMYFSEIAGTPSIGDREGGTGLDYRSSADPRVSVMLLGQDGLGNNMYFPGTLASTDQVTLTLADGIEARLIEAEAALTAGRADWLTILNALRTDGTYDTQPNASEPSQTDTLWHAGTGGVAGLRPLADPGAHDAQVDLVFRERAFWLYLTAHRQGDLRRLIRHYGRAATAVFPTGTYGSAGSYGDDVTFPVPASEKTLNPKYTGCFNRSA